MADDLPPDEPPLSPEDEEISSIRRLEVVRDQESGKLPPEGAEVLVFRNADSEPVVVPTAVATEAERAYRCYKLHRKGWDWIDIAEQEQYPSARACKADVDRYLEEGRSLIVEASAKHMLALEVGRLNELQRYLWDKAEEGSVAAITEIRHLIMSRAVLVEKLNIGLVENGDAGNTVVVPRQKEGYIATLQAAAGNAPATTEL